MDSNPTIVKVKDVKMYFPITRGVLFQHRVGAIRAVDGVSFEIMRGETFGLVGESGCGKSTIARAMLQLHKPTSGEVYFEDVNLSSLKGEAMRKMRHRMQMIFQDPCASLTPRMTIGEIISEAMMVHNIYSGHERLARVKELLKIVGLDPAFVTRYPHEFSGGQRQRIGIARALSVNPDFIVCDEPISALDVSIQAQIINLLRDLQEKYNLTYMFIAHDLSVVRHISSRVAVMYLGKVAELTTRKELYENPLHPYTRALLSAVPIPDPIVEGQRRRIILEGDLPSPASPPPGCNFHTRCPQAMDICRQEVPRFLENSNGHWVACHLVNPQNGSL